MAIYPYIPGATMSDPHPYNFKPSKALAVMDSNGSSHDVTAMWRKSEIAVDGTHYWAQVFPCPWQQIREEITVKAYKTSTGVTVTPSSMEFSYTADVGNNYDWVAKGQDSVSTIHAIYEESWHSWVNNETGLHFLDVTGTGDQDIFVRAKYSPNKYFVNVNGALFTHKLGFEFYTSSLNLNYLNVGDHITQYFRFKLTGFKASAIFPVLSDNDREYKLFPIGSYREEVEIVSNTWVSHDQYDDIWYGGVNDSI